MAKKQIKSDKLTSFGVYFHYGEDRQDVVSYNRLYFRYLTQT